MRITSKGHVTIPAEIRVQARPLPHTRLLHRCSRVDRPIQLADGLPRSRPSMRSSCLRSQKNPNSAIELSSRPELSVGTCGFFSVSGQDGAPLTSGSSE
jgi:hypothetical protein